MSTRKPRLEECPNVLIVEGYSDLLFYAACLRHLNRHNNVYIQSFEGKSKICDRNILGTFLNEKLLAEKMNIAILLDADNNPAGTARSVQDHLQAITGRTVKEGQWEVQDGQARLGFFVAPDTSTNGEIETLAWNAFSPEQKHEDMKAAVEDYLAGMDALGWKAQSVDKARIGAYLAAAYDEDPRLGPGARERKFDFDAPGFVRLREFFEVLPTSGS